MALVNVLNMVVLDNPTHNFTNPFQFEITFECLQPLEDDLEWKIIYVGSAESSSHDQVLDEILVGPIPVGVNKFILQSDGPDLSTIPEDDILGVTVVLVTCSYRDQEFVRIGYYVNNEYSIEYDPEVGPPKPLDPRKVVRTILADKPRVTRVPIQWHGNDLMSATAAASGGGEAAAEAEAMESDDPRTSAMNDGDLMSPDKGKILTAPSPMVTPELSTTDEAMVM